MISITEVEKKIISKQYPGVQIARTMKQDSKRHHYYMVEERAPMELLMELRGVKKKPQDSRGTRAKSTIMEESAKL